MVFKLYYSYYKYTVQIYYDSLLIAYLIVYL